MIEFQNVSKLYGDKEALSNLNLQIEAALKNVIPSDR